MTLDVRFLAENEVHAFRVAVIRAFGSDYAPDPQLDARFKASFDRDLSIGAFDGSNLVGTFASFDLDLTIPGGRVPMAGTTVVSVQPTHRRRGLLSRMMRLHLEQAQERQQPLAALWATDFGIYGRFGYGPANDWREISFDARKLTIPPEPGVDLRFLTLEEAKSIAPKLYGVAAGERPGMYERPDWWWEHRVFLDHKEFREGMSEHRWVVAEVDGEPVGYVLYRTKLKWESDGAEGKVAITEVISTSDAARRALWHFLSNVDLFPNVEYWNAPPDEILPWLMSDPRQLKHSIAEALWVRILDIAGALEARGYESDGTVILGITDEFFNQNSGSYQVEVRDGRAHVTRSNADPQIQLTVGQLGSLYLGHHRATALHRSGRIAGSSADVELLDRIMRWSVPSWTQEIF